jgi:hypothetical protein
VKKLLAAAVLVAGIVFAVPSVAGAAESTEAAAAVGPCTPYVTTSLVAVVCTVRSGEYSASVTPSLTLPAWIRLFQQPARSFGAGK